MTKEPDAFEKSARFGCGAFFGMILGFFTLAQLFIWSFWIPLALAASIALLFGYLSMKFGDIFWDKLKDWIRFWPR